MERINDTDLIDVLCITSKLCIGGVQTFLMNSVAPLMKYGVRLNFAVETTEPQVFDKYVKSLGCNIYPITPLHKSKLHFIKDIRKILKETPTIKIVHGHRNFANIYSMLATKGLAKYVSHAHSNYKPKSFINKVLKIVFKFILPTMANGYWACSEEAAVWLYGNHSKSNRCKIIKNAISTERFMYDEEKRKSVRNSLGLENDFIWIHVGSFSQTKNHRFLINLFSESIKHNPNQHLFLCGDGALRKDIETQIKDFGLEHKITITGAILNTQDYLSAADLFVFPSLFEGFSLSCLEAQASGIPGVVSMAVTDSCIINPNIRKINNLSIDEYLNGIKIVSGIPFQRKDGGLNVKDSGYDVNDEARKIAQYYTNLLK